jgi:microcystin degradation protein MlrC
MIRTQVYLTEEQARDIKDRARREQRPDVEVIRELIDRGRQETQAGKKKPVASMLARLDKLGLTGPTDLSVNHDDYFYGDK